MSKGFGLAGTAHAVFGAGVLRRGALAVIAVAVASMMLILLAALPSCSAFVAVNKNKSTGYHNHRWECSGACTLPPSISEAAATTTGLRAVREETESSASSSSGTIREEIEAMRIEAAERLLKLEERVRELQRQQDELKEDEKRQVKHDRIVTAQQQQQQQQQEEQKDRHERKDVAAQQQMKKQPKPTPASAASPASASAVAVAAAADKYERLDGTRWKFGFNLGREPGTWMPQGWGASGTRLYFEVVADFAPDANLDERDDFFVGRAGCKKLRVRDAWMFPTGTGSESVGRRTIRVAPEGTYKVLPGQGPRGTDIVRLCLDVEDDRVAHDDVSCPAGRIYATCGYFATADEGGAAASAADSAGSSFAAQKDELAAEHRALATQYEQLKLEDEQDPNPIHKIGRMGELFRMRKQLDDVAQQLQHARQAHPEKSELRFSRDRRVALSREGGVCRKVHKGLTVEYHILGRVEVASIRCDDGSPSDHDEYRDLVRDMLHP